MLRTYYILLIYSRIIFPSTEQIKSYISMCFLTFFLRMIDKGTIKHNITAIIIENSTVFLTKVLSMSAKINYFY
jgi:hypothetical protein